MSPARALEAVGAWSAADWLHAVEGLLAVVVVATTIAGALAAMRFDGRADRKGG